MSTGKKLRLMLFEECNRACPGCCNNNINFDTLPFCTDYSEFDEIMLTGGEPMLQPKIIRQAISEIRRQTDTPIYLYTALTSDPASLARIINSIEGVTITLHIQDDVDYFRQFIQYYQLQDDKSLRLKVFKGIDLRMPRLVMLDWHIIDNLEMREDCPLPEGEVLMKYLPLADTNFGHVTHSPESLAKFTAEAMFSTCSSCPARGFCYERESDSPEICAEKIKRWLAHKAEK